MSFCSHCGNQMETGDKFCRVCGTAVPEESAPQNVPAPVAVKAEPVISGKVKALGFVGMGLGIGGVVFGALGVLYTLIGMAMPPMGITFALIFGLFSVPLSIVGRILSYKSIEGGNTSGVCSAGTKLGMAGLIVSAVMLFFGFINLINCASYSY